MKIRESNQLSHNTGDECVASDCISLNMYNLACHPEMLFIPYPMSARNSRNFLCPLIVQVLNLRERERERVSETKTPLAVIILACYVL